MNEQLKATKRAARTDSQREANAPVRREERKRLTDGPALNMEVYGTIPGYHLHIVVDLDGDIERQLHRGYNFVEFGEIETNSRKGHEADADNRISWHSGTDEGGKPYRSYLMKMEQELWDELQEDNRAMLAEQTAELQNRALANGDGRYVPQRGINIQR